MPEWGADAHECSRCEGGPPCGSDQALLRLAEESPRGDRAAVFDPVLFARSEGWRPGRSLGPPTSALFYYYRLKGGVASGQEFSKSLTVLGFRRRVSRGLHCVLMHHVDAEELKRWAKRNPTPENIRQAMNSAARPSQRRLPPPTGS